MHLYVDYSIHFLQQFCEVSILIISVLLVGEERLWEDVTYRMLPLLSCRVRVQIQQPDTSLCS